MGERNSGYVTEDLRQPEPLRNESLYNRIYDNYPPAPSGYVPAPDPRYSTEQIGIPHNRPIRTLPFVEFSNYQNERAFLEANSRFPNLRNIDQVPVQEIAAELTGGQITQDFYLKCHRVYSLAGPNADAAVGHLVDQLNFGLQSLGSPYNLVKDTVFTPYGPRIVISLHNGPMVLGKVDLR